MVIKVDRKRATGTATKTLRITHRGKGQVALSVFILVVLCSVRDFGRTHNRLSSLVAVSDTNLISTGGNSSDNSIINDNDEEKNASGTLLSSEMNVGPVSSPEPDDNSIAENPARSSQSCQWIQNGTLLPCKKEILKTFPDIRNATHWFFIGDSTVARMTSTFPPSFADQMERLRYSDRNVKNHYYRKIPSMRGVFPPDSRVVANGTLGEGPFPADHTGTTCTTCRNGLYKQVVNDTTTRPSPPVPVAWEFLAMEFSKDRTFQTKQTTTSQETMILYMKLANQEGTSREQTVCVINTGFHDMSIEPRMSAQLYVENSLWMLRLFLQEGQCGVILWLGMNAVAYKKTPRWPQTNDRIDEWNQALARAMSTEDDHRSSLFFLDVFDKSKSTKHVDYLHMDGTAFYRPLSAFFADLILDTNDDIYPTT